MPHINGKCFPGEEMGWDGIPSKGIQYQQVEALRRFLGQREPRIALHECDRSWTLGEKCKVGLGYVDYLRINLIEPYRVSTPAVRGNRARPKPDYTYTTRWPVWQCSEGVLKAAATAIKGQSS